MATYQQYKQQVLQLFERAIPLAVHYRYPEIQKHLEEAKKHLEDGKLFVVVCGEFKQGKSCLLNAFLNEPDLFPVDLDITTNLVSTITYGEEEKITVVLEDKGKEVTKQIKRSEIPDYVTEQRNAKNAKKAKILLIESPNVQLKEGLVLVDTPGIGSINTEHTAITYSFIPYADAILFVTDALKPLTTEEIKFLKERIVPHCQHLIFVVTKIDALSDTEKIVENNRQKLAHALDCPAEAITIIAVSSRAKLDYLKYEETQDLKYSNFAELEKQIWQLASQEQGSILLLRALGELGQSAGEMKAPMEVAWEAHQERTKEELDRLESQLQAVQDQLQNLLENNAEWRTILSDGLQDIHTDLIDKFQQDFAQIRYQVNQYLEDSSLMDSPKQIAGLVEADIDVLMSNLSKNLNQQAANLYARLENLTGLNLSRFEVGLSNRQKAYLPKEEIRVQQTGLVDKSLTATRSALFNTTAGSVIGGVLGAIGGAIGGFLFGGGVGAIPAAIAGAQWGSGLGGVAGFAKGAKDGLSQIHEKDRGIIKQEVRKIIAPFVEDSQRLCGQTLNKAVKALERSMRDEFTNQIKRQQEGWKRTLRSLQESRKLSQAEATKSSQELQIPLQQLTQLQDKIAQLAQAIAEQPFTVTSPSSPPPKAQTQVPPKQKVIVATDTNADYGDWADE